MSRYSAKSGDDDLVHRVEAEPDALIDPSPHRTRCDRAVLEVYNVQLPVTCPECARRDDNGE